MRSLSDEGVARTATPARDLHGARVTRYHELRPGPHRRLYTDELWERGRWLRRARPSFGYRRVWWVLRCPAGMFIHRHCVRRSLKEEGFQ